MYCTDPMVQWTGHSTGIDWEPIVGTAGSIDKIPRTNHVGYECSDQLSTQGARKVQSINHDKCVPVQYEKCIAVQWYRRQSRRGNE